MIDWVEIVFWILAITLIHESVAQSAQERYGVLEKKKFSIGVAIVLISAGLWYWNAWSFQKLADTLQIPHLNVQSSLTQGDLEKLPTSESRQKSIQLAKTEFINNGKLLNILNDEGRWVLYSPSVEDANAREQQLKTLEEVNSQRQELNAWAQIANKRSKQWLVSLVVAIFIGLVAKQLRIKRKFDQL